jgi:hypothetical protein
MSDRFEFADDQHVERLVGTLTDSTASPGDVLTVQADGSIAGQLAAGVSPFKTVTFDTPNLLATAGGIPFATPAAGDLLAGLGSDSSDVWPLLVPVAWDGTTPRLIIFAQGDDPTSPAGLIASTAGLTSADAAFGPGIVGQDSYASFGTPAMAVSNGTPLLLALDDGSGGDPGCSQGTAKVAAFFVQLGSD